MKKISIIVSILLLSIGFSYCKRNNNSFSVNYTVDYEAVASELALEILKPIRPGIPGETPFWNEYARRFIYVPSFNLPVVANASKYLFTATSFDETKYSFIGENPWSDISPIWSEIPVGFVNLEVIGLDDNEEVLGISGEKQFYKAAPFNGPYHDRKLDYKVSMENALAYFYELDYIQSWAVSPVPDTLKYGLYSYPSKTISAVVDGMIIYNQIYPKDYTIAMEIANNAAKYLINISEPKGAPLEFFPPTYMGEFRTAKSYKDQFMMIYPAKTALTYLDLYDVTENIFYKDAAIRIAETYEKLQLPSGTWKLKLWVDGTPVTDNDCIPIDMIKLFERLESQYELEIFTSAKDKAFNWLMNNPMKTFNWSGQFEDISPVEPYVNLSKDEASAIAIYFFDRINEDSRYEEFANELLRFCEDQFVIWEKPMPQSQYNVGEWITPCVLEQYHCYEPINASASNMIEAFLKGYQATGRETYLAKAIELSNAMTISQLANGRYPTYWQLNERQDESVGWIDWLNCTSYSIKTMLVMSEFMSSRK